MIGLAMTDVARVLRAARGASLAAPLTGLALAVAAPAAADHPMADARGEGMSPMMLALVTGGLALAAALLVLVIVMLLTRKPSPAERAGE